MCGPTPNDGSETNPEILPLGSSVLLRGVVGSSAYGLAREGSDVDRLGIFVLPTEKLLGLGVPVQTVTRNKPDVTLHEVGKYLGLALKCNPTILELLWLDKHDMKSFWGQRLIDIRWAFLSETGVRNVYHGYATAQVNRLQRRELEGKPGFGDVPVNRTAKHARHCMRLLRQGRELLETGNLTIKVPDPEFYWQFDDASVDDIVRVFQVESNKFSDTVSVLPEKPSKDLVQSVLLSIRRDFYDY